MEKQKCRNKFLMADPYYYKVVYKINPWMIPEKWNQLECYAIDSWKKLVSFIKEIGGKITILPSYYDVPDFVFTANLGIILDNKILLSKFKYKERQKEEKYFKEWAEKQNWQIQEQEYIQEGAGDCIYDPYRQMFWFGYGQRSNEKAKYLISYYFDKPLTSLELINPNFYHLDTCFCPLPNGEILYYPKAFSKKSLVRLKEVEKDFLIEINDEEAFLFSANAICIDRTIIIGNTSNRLKKILQNKRYEIKEIDTKPFIMSGGSVACLTLKLN